MAFSIRRAVDTDAEELAELAASTFKETFDWYNTPENMQVYADTHFSRQQIKSEIKDSRAVIFLAFWNQDLVAYAKLKESKMPEPLPERQAREIERIYVRKAFQNKKIGLALMNQCLEEARRCQAECVWLGVWEHNPKAIRFYDKIGFTRFGSHTFQLGDDAQLDFLMKLDLT